MPAGVTLDPRNQNGMPRYGPRVDGGLVPYTPTPLPAAPVPGRSQPMLGATVVASFEADALRLQPALQVPFSLAALR